MSERKPNCLYVGGATFIAHWKRNFASGSPQHVRRVIIVVISLCLTTTVDTINKIDGSSFTPMARKIIILVRMDKKGKSPKIIALTTILISNPNFSSVSFRPNCISSFFTFHQSFYFEWVLKWLIPEETTFRIKLNVDFTSIWCSLDVTTTIFAHFET